MYVATGKGAEMDALSPVSQMTRPVSSTDMFDAIVYVAEFRLQVAKTSMAEGVFERLV